VRASRCVFLGRRGQRLLLQNLLHRPIDAVIPVNACQMPLDHLRHGVLVCRVEGLKLRDGDFHQVAIHLRLRRSLRLGCRDEGEQEGQGRGRFQHALVSHRQPGFEPQNQPARKAAAFSSRRAGRIVR
jgi:hypothetical protein